MYKRLLQLPANPENVFFLWGPRQTGKTTFLKATYPEAMRIDLLKTEELMRGTQEPSLLRAYVQDYLREEVMEEGLTRSLPVFSDFLRVAAIGDTEVVEHLIIVCLEPRRRKTDEGIHILPCNDFVESLWAGQWTDSLN